LSYYTGLLIDLAKECEQDASRTSAIQPTSPSNDNNYSHEKHWFGSISSEPHILRNKNIGASMPVPVAVDGISPMNPCTWEEWQSHYEIIHNTTATPTLSYAIYGSSKKHRILDTVACIHAFSQSPEGIYQER
jgi:hypothetical protein